MESKKLKEYLANNLTVELSLSWGGALTVRLRLEGATISEDKVYIVEDMD